MHAMVRHIMEGYISLLGVNRIFVLLYHLLGSGLWIGMSCIAAHLWAQNVGITDQGSITPHASALLELLSTERGVLIPRMTTAQRDAIASPANSLLIFNTTENCIQIYNQSVGTWENVYCFKGCAAPPPAPSTLSPTAINLTSFTAQWNASTGASSYILEVATDAAFTSPLPGYNGINVGNVLSYNVTGLSCGKTYYYRVRAQNACGLSPWSTAQAVTTSACPQFCLRVSAGSSTNDEGKAIAATADGGFVVAGQTNLGGNDGVYVLKFDNLANLQWSRIIGGPGSSVDYANSIIQTSDGGYAVAGVSEIGGGSHNIYVIRLSASGNLLWSRRIGTSNLDRARQIIQTQDGGFAIVGFSDVSGSGTNFETYVGKLDASGNLQWSRRIGSSTNDGGHSIVQLPDESFVVVGYSTAGGGDNEFYIVRLDINGSIIESYRSNNSSQDILYRVIRASDGNIVVAGATNSAGSYDMYIAKINPANFTILWQSRVGTSTDDRAYDLLEDEDGNYVIVGFTVGGGGAARNAYVAKFNSSGTLQWTRQIGVTGNPENGEALCKASDGGYILAGWTGTSGSRDVYIVKIASDGSVCSSCDQGTGGSTSSLTITLNSVTSSINNLGNPTLVSSFLRSSANVTAVCP